MKSDKITNDVRVAIVVPLITSTETRMVTLVGFLVTFSVLVADKLIRNSDSNGLYWNLLWTGSVSTLAFATFYINSGYRKWKHHYLDVLRAIAQDYSFDDSTLPTFMREVPLPNLAGWTDKILIYLPLIPFTGFCIWSLVLGYKLFCAH